MIEVKEMALLQQWRDIAYDQSADKGKLQRFWAVYFEKEKNIYAELLKNPDQVVSGTVKELAEKFGVDVMTMTGFLDGINDSLKAENPIWRLMISGGHFTARYMFTWTRRSF